VAISGDRAIVGAPFDTVNPFAQGSATIFRRETTGAWVAEHGILNIPTPKKMS
jgi:hypothetical protein